ncbi:hypothetical protein [Paenibacillus monticola]|uniref:Uncharacterized protein n=1 Tax=Paenibacillus monticola TaxID=2666075 RepID=A0A7X2L0U9_9BACL|nr:hypothetical protein [Paenibacillus monticola]MRN51666.1 hypothetical protein [Paenibacillus monticola]
MYKTLLDIRSTIIPADRHVHLVHRFALPQGISKLVITFAYSPKKLEDMTRINELVVSAVERYVEADSRMAAYGNPDYGLLHNLLTVSLDDPAGFRGAAHRPSPEQKIFLAESEATPGFLAGPLPSGLWELTISLHEIVTDTCQFHLQVQSEEERRAGV